MLGHQDSADTLRLVAPGIQGLGVEGVTWAWSLAWAVVQGAVRLFDLDEDDIEARVLTRDHEGHTEALEIIWVDSVLGGSGILQELVGRFPSVAASAVEHLGGHDCPSSCYRCLRTYRNQRVHGILNWRLALPYLQAAAISEVIAGPPESSFPGQGPEWEEARRQGCESPLELRLLEAIRSANMAEPLKQYEVFTPEGRLITRADFAYTTPRRVLIYADGLEFHSRLGQRVHDGRITNRLQSEGWQVLRFLGFEISRNIASCVAAIERALGAQR
jgi:very-short-patch-repair endonuclease